MASRAPQAASRWAAPMSISIAGRFWVRLVQYLPRVRAAVLGLCLLSLHGGVVADGLRYSVSGVDGALKDNIEAWLGEPPETAAGRENFAGAARERALNALHAMGYYAAEVEVTVNRDRSTWRLKVRASPNDPVRIRDVQVRVTGDIADTDLVSDLVGDPPLKTGAVFNHGTYEALKSTLVATAQRHGFFDGRFTSNRVAVNLAEKTADIDLAYDSGSRYRFGALQFDPDQISDTQVDSLASFSDGDPFELSSLQRLQADLQRTGYYSSVLLRPDFDAAEDGRIPVSLSLTPAKRHSFNLGIGFRTDTEERVSVTWRTPKINAAGHSQETRLEYSPINPSGRTTYRIPLTHPLNDVLHLTARVEDNEFGDLDSRQSELGIRREFRRKQWVDSYLVRALDERWDVAGQSQENVYVLPGFTLSKRSLSGPLTDPSHGFSQFYQLEGASEALGSDIDLVRGYVRFGAITTLTPGHRLVGRLELGAAWVDDSDRTELAPSLNFFAGGAQSIRGFAYQSIGNTEEVENEDGTTRRIVVGGDKLVVGSVEYQYDYNDNWRAALFSDFGDAFDSGEFDSHYSLGFGIHYLTVVGAIKAQIAYPLSEDDPSWRFHLDIGAQF